MFFNRKLVDMISAKLESNKIIVLLGARQTGKTTILKLITQKLSPHSRQVFIDLDLLSNRSIFVDDLSFLRYLENNGYSKEDKNLFYVFVDEFQNVYNSTLIFKSIYDNFPNIKIIASGSSSLKMKQRIAESMVGRSLVFYLHPLDFEEFLSFQARDDLRQILKNRNLSQRYVEELNYYIEEFIVYGGYPDIAKTRNVEEKKEYLESIFEFYLQKDIRDFANIRNIQKFQAVLKYLSLINGNLLRVNTIATELGIHQNTVEDYLAILEDTFLIKRLPSYFQNKTNSLRKTKKIFFIDTGFRNYLIRSFTPLALRNDVGSLLETHVFAELYKRVGPRQEIFFYRTKQGAEIDFIKEGEERLILIEVKKKATSRPPIFNSFPGARENIVSFEPAENIGQTEVLSILNFFHFLDIIEKTGPMRVTDQKLSAV